MVFFHFDFLLYNPSRRKKTENLLDRIISLDLQNYDLLQGQTVFFGNYAGINVWLKRGRGGGGVIKAYSCTCDIFGVEFLRLGTGK